MDYQITARQHGWAEQNPELWWQDLCNVTRSLLSEHQLNPALVGAIGISYQMHGLVVVDKSNNVLRPAIIWSDGRAVSIGKQAFKDLGEEYCLRQLLNSPGNFTASKLKWVKDNEPAIYDQIDKFLLPGDYIALKLTGERQTTISGLSEAILWDFQEKKISTSVLDYFEISESLVPDVVPTFSIQGKITSLAASQCGLLAGTPLTYRAGDQPNNALSLNVMSPGEIAASSAESGVVYGIVNQPKFDRLSRVNTFAHVNYDDKNDNIGVLLCLNGAGKQYGWLKDQIAVEGRKYKDMERIASTIPVGSDGLCVLPFGNGAERILEDKNIYSHILNLDFNRHSRGHIYRAALEGVAFSFVHGVNVLKEMGINVDVIRVGSTDMFESEVFSMTLATMLDCQVEQIDTNGSVGAARAAGIAIGQYANISEALSGLRPKAIFEPRLNHMMCSQAYHLWLSCLNKTLYELPSNSNRTDTLKQANLLLKKEIEHKDQDMAKYTLKLSEKDDFLSEIKNRLLRISNEENPQQSLSKLAQLIDQQSDSQKEWKDFQDKFNVIQSDFFKKLKRKHPSLTATDAKLCSLIKLQLTTKEIASKLNISVRGMETRRYRLRKKLGLGGIETLDQYLDQF